MSLPRPAAASAYPGRDGVWPRRLLALTVGAAVSAAAATALLRAPSFELYDLNLIVWLLIGARLLEKKWSRRRSARLVWRPRVVGPYGVESGLVARRSLAGWLDLVAAVACATPMALGLISLLPDDQEWAPLARIVLLAGGAVGLGAVAFREVRFTGLLALTASGIRQGREWYDWTNVDRVSLHRRDGRVDGVRLRQVVRKPLEPAPVVGGRSVAVSDERLLAAIDHFRTRPEMLTVGLPVTAPEPADGPANG